MHVPLLLLTLTTGHLLAPGTFDRGIQLTVSPDVLQVTYEVSADDATLEHWLAAHAGESLEVAIAERLHLVVDGERRHLTPQGMSLERRHHARATFTFIAPCTVERGGNAVHLRDHNFADEPSTVRMALAGRDGVDIAGSSLPVTLQRATRQSLARLSPEKRHAASSLSATLHAPPPAVGATIPATVWVATAGLFCLLWWTIRRLHRKGAGAMFRAADPALR